MNLRRLRGSMRSVLNRVGWDVHRFVPDDSLATLIPWLGSRLGINCVLDVGARYGEYRDYIRQYGYTGRIVSFEPVSSNFEVLERTGARDPQWHGYRCALGSASATASINVTRSTNFSSLHMPTALSQRMYPDSAVERTEQCEVRRLDELFADAVFGIDDPRVYLKLDTQGWDLEVVRGARACLPRILALQCEMSVTCLYEGAPTYSAALAELTEAGFGLSAIFRVNWDADCRLVEFDAVMVRGERACATRVHSSGA
jgi:FkbM family methyltransferase